MKAATVGQFDTRSRQGKGQVFICASVVAVLFSFLTDSALACSHYNHTFALLESGRKTTIKPPRNCRWIGDWQDQQCACMRACVRACVRVCVCVCVSECGK